MLNQGQNPFYYATPVPTPPTPTPTPTPTPDDGNKGLTVIFVIIFVVIILIILGFVGKICYDKHIKKTTDAQAVVYNNANSSTRNGSMTDGMLA